MQLKSTHSWICRVLKGGRWKLCLEVYVWYCHENVHCVACLQSLSHGFPRLASIMSLWYKQGMVNRLRWKCIHWNARPIKKKSVESKLEVCLHFVASFPGLHHHPVCDCLQCMWWLDVILGRQTGGSANQRILRLFFVPKDWRLECLKGSINTALLFWCTQSWSTQIVSTNWHCMWWISPGLSSPFWHTASNQYLAREGLGTRLCISFAVYSLLPRPHFSIFRGSGSKTIFVIGKTKSSWQD